MARIKSPFFSVSASGTIGKSLTFSKRRSFQQCRWQRKQKDSNTISQKSQRSLFLFAQEIIKYRDFGNCVFGFSLYGINKDGLKDQSLGKQMTWYNYIISKILKCP